MNLNINNDIQELENAIKHYEEKIAECRENGQVIRGLQHLQLKNWLIELREIKLIVTKGVNKE